MPPSPTPSSCSALSFETISQVVTWVIVVVGWYFVDRRNNYREQRKEDRSFCNQLIGKVENTLQHALEYHSSEAQDPKLARQIKFNLQRLSYSLGHIKYESKDVMLFTKMIGFRQAITYQNFESHSFATQDIDSLFILNLDQSSVELIEEIEKVFRKKYNNRRK